MGCYHILVDGSYCQQQFNSNNNNTAAFNPSKRLLGDAKKYEEMFLGNKNRLAVMLRVDRFYLKEKHRPRELNTLEKCFQKVIEASKNGKGDQHPWP